MKRRKPLSTDPEKVAEWRRKSRLRHASTLRRSMIERKTRIKARNPKRKAERYAKQFGEKSEWLRERHPECQVTGDTGNWFFRVEHAHVQKTRAAGADSTHLVPLRMDVHNDFDGSITDERFAEKWGRSREWIRERAKEIHAEWMEAA